jgi:hypothetical protein
VLRVVRLQNRLPRRAMIVSPPATAFPAVSHSVLKLLTKVKTNLGVGWPQDFFGSAANRKRPQRVLTSHAVCHVASKTCMLSVNTFANVTAV